MSSVGMILAGGAPLRGGASYPGIAVVQQKEDGSWRCSVVSSLPYLMTGSIRSSSSGRTINIRKYTRAIVNADELAMFVNTGQVVGTMGPGRHQIDADEIPGLGAVIDWATGGNAYRAELYFVGTREYPGNMFGGRIDDVQDPQTGMIVTLRVFGDYSMKVKDPVALITNLVGTVDVANNDAITGWMSDQLLKVMRTHMTMQIVRNGWPILGLSAYTPDIEEEVMAKGNEQLASYGVAIIRMGNFDINLSEQDEAQLKTLAKDTAYSRLAGSFQQYAAGEMPPSAPARAWPRAVAPSVGLSWPPGSASAARPPHPWLPDRRLRPARASRAAAPALPVRPRRAQPRPARSAPTAMPATRRGPSSAPRAGRRWRRRPRCAPSCHAENPAGAKFCASCGTADGDRHAALHVVRSRDGGGRPLLPVLRHGRRRGAVGRRSVRGAAGSGPAFRSVIAASPAFCCGRVGARGSTAEAVVPAGAVAAAWAEAAGSSSSAVAAEARPRARC